MFVKNTKIESIAEAVKQVVEASPVKIPTPTGTRVLGTSYGNSAKTHRDQISDPFAAVKGPGKKDLENIEKPKKKQESFSAFTNKLLNSLEEDKQIQKQIDEVLKKDASAGDWIHDFVHSDNPKFAGKSKAERKKMALGAYYAKQNEEVEQFDEAAKPNELHVVDDGVGRYKVRAVGSNHAHDIKVGEHLTNKHLDDFHDKGVRVMIHDYFDDSAERLKHKQVDEAKKESKKDFDDRQKRLAAASSETAKDPERLKKLSKIPGYTAAMDLAKKTTKEEVEQIDEIGNTPAGQAALRAVDARGTTAMDTWNKNPASGYTKAPKRTTKQFVGAMNADRRLHGFGPDASAKGRVQRQMDHEKRMRGEEVEQLDELGNTPAGQAALKAVYARGDKEISDWNKKPESGYSSAPKKVVKHFAGGMNAHRRLLGKGISTGNFEKAKRQMDYAKKMRGEEVEQVDEAVTRKHFQQVADLIKSHDNPGKRKELAQHHAEIFKQQNPRFDHGKFMKACNVNEWKEEVEQQDEALIGNQKKIDKNHNNKIDAQDFKILRSKKVDEVLNPSNKTIDTLAGRSKKVPAEAKLDNSHTSAKTQLKAEAKTPEHDDVPFDPPYRRTSDDDTVTDKSGAKHTPMSRAKHLAQTALQRVKSDLKAK
jgi:hypothetical protein